MVRALAAGCASVRNKVLDISIPALPSLNLLTIVKKDVIFVSFMPQV